MARITPLLGWLGFVFGLITAAATPFSGWGTYLAMFCMIPGFLLSSLYIMFSSKYEIKSGWINPGYVGLLLSSAPLLIALIGYLINGNNQHS